MVGFEEAYEIMLEYLPESGKVVHAYEGPDHFFFGVVDKFGLPILDFSPVMVSKTTGGASIAVPSVPYFVSGDPPTDSELELENASPIDDRLIALQA